MSHLFLKLVTLYVKVVCLATNLGPENNIKALLSGYAKIYSQTNVEIEPNWNKVTRFMRIFYKPIHAIEESLQPISSKLITLLLTLKPEIDQSIALSGESLRKMALLSLTPQMSGLKVSNVSEKLIRSAAYQYRNFELVSIILLICPSELIKSNHCAELFRQSISYGYMVTVFRNEVNIYFYLIYKLRI